MLVIVPFCHEHDRRAADHSRDPRPYHAARSARPGDRLLPENEPAAVGADGFWRWRHCFSCVHAAALPALLLGLFGGALTFRWFARCYAFVEGRMRPAIASDIVYAAALIFGLAVLAIEPSCHSDARRGACCWRRWPAVRRWDAISSPSNLPRSRRQFAPLCAIFRDVTRWSLLGVVFTELTVNAHAYLVTFVAGPGTFALLALGMLLMRPASLVQSALPDLERPAMTAPDRRPRLARPGAHPAGIRLRPDRHAWLVDPGAGCRAARSGFPS